MTYINHHIVKTALAFSILLSPVAALADDLTITQAGKQFSQAKATIKPGEKIIFVNDDNVAHNIYTIINGKKRDLGLQKPGESGDVAFDSAGNYRIRCAIHPKMKLAVKVAE